jgi:hypothetical protein
MRLWKPHDPGRSCLPLTIRHHVANETDSQNDGALAAPLTGAEAVFTAARPRGLNRTNMTNRENAGPWGRTARGRGRRKVPRDMLLADDLRVSSQDDEPGGPTGSAH